MVGPAHGIAAFFDVAQNLVEDGICAAMGRNDFELAAPGSDRLGDAIEETLVGVQSEFVEDDVAALARECVWIGAEGVDAPTVFKTQDVTSEAFVGVEDFFAVRLCLQLKYVRPIFAIFEEQACLRLIARRNPDVQKRANRPRALDGGISGGEGDAWEVINY